MKRLLIITAALIALTGPAMAAPTFEQVAVTANFIAAGINQYRIIVAFIVQNDDQNIGGASVTCSLFVKTKLMGTAVGFINDVPPLAKANGFASGGLEDFKPDSAECTLQILSR
jgi:hypothetical protein